MVKMGGSNTTGMRIEKSLSSIDDSGTPIDEFGLSESPYETVTISRFTNDTGDRSYRVEARQSSGDVDVYVFHEQPMQFIGVTPEVERRLIPDDIQDVLIRSGKVPLPNLAFFNEGVDNE